MISLERTLFTYFENTKNYLKSRPLNLGGMAGSGGGSGGPPGGYWGYLPQTRVAYDYSEAASSGIPFSGSPTLLDNLNHIRYRLEVIEESGGGGTGKIDIYKNGSIVASGITSLNIRGELNVTASGDVATIEHPRTNTEYFAVVSGSTNFETQYIFLEDSIKVFVDGLRKFNTTFSEAGSRDSFTFTSTIPSGSFVVCDYLYYSSEQSSGGWGTSWGTSWGES